MKKIPHFAEGAYLVGELLIAFGTAMMEKANMGVSMVVAPAYLISLKIEALTFGMAEYMLQAVLLILMCLVLRQFRVGYIFSFVTAVFYGLLLDGSIALLAPLAADTWLVRIFLYVTGMLIVSAGVSFVFHTYLAPAVYELTVKEISSKFHLDINKFKICFDCGCFIVAVVISLLFFGDIRGVWWGTVICALLNGLLIGMFSRVFEPLFDFSPALPKLEAWFKK